MLLIVQFSNNYTKNPQCIQLGFFKRVLRIDASLTILYIDSPMVRIPFYSFHSELVIKTHLLL